MTRPELFPLASLLFCAFTAPLAAADAPAPSPANRLTYLDESDPFYVNVAFPKLTTPQWAGEPGVRLAVTLAIDDMGGNVQIYENVLRPVINRLKELQGTASVSIMCNSVNPDAPQLQSWLGEGVSLEVHTLSHPCPILAMKNFGMATNTFHGGVNLLNTVSNNKPLAFRTPCCDSINSPSPRLFAEIFNRVNSAGQFLTIDSSVMNITTAKDPAVPREMVVDADGRDKFRKYVPFASFVTTIDNYPYPYIIGRKCWEFPAMAPSDWEAQNLHGRTNPVTLADWKAAIDAAYLKKGNFNLIFHPAGWSDPAQIVGIIDHAVGKYGKGVRFYNFQEAQRQLNRNLLAGVPIRSANGDDNGVRLLDLNNDGYLDVVIGNDQKRLTRVWNPSESKWIDSDFPVKIVEADASGHHSETGVRFGVVRSDGFASFFVGNEKTNGFWHFDGTKWVEAKEYLQGLEIGGKPVLSAKGRRDQGVRFRDVNNDGRCELIVGNDGQQAVFDWSEEGKAWRRMPVSLPPGTSIVNAEGEDNGLRFVDLNEDGYDDVVFSNEKGYAVYLYVPAPFLGWGIGWNREVTKGKRGDEGEVPMIVRDGPYRNNGAWFHSRHLWVQNEDTAHMPNLVDRRSYDQLLTGLLTPPKSPEEGLASLRLPKGFKAELVAHEPQVLDPVAFDWGADGKLWVVETRDYPLGVDGNGKPGGVVLALEDADGDGFYEKSTVFLDNLPFPNGVMPWRKGVLVSAAPDIIYAEDTNGDGKADFRKVLFHGFTEGNPQHRVNGFEYGLDNWIHGANGDSGGAVESVMTGKTVGISGSDFRFRPDDGSFERQEGVTQFGRHRDDWGNWFGNSNPIWLWHYVLPQRYLVRNTQLAVRSTRKELANYDHASRVYPSSRPQQRLNVVGEDNAVTSANSATPYRDDLFGPEFATSVFVSEPAQNSVHREVLTQDGATFRSRRADGEATSEFLSSTDNWFRPTQMKTGPDGALYVADMYRLIIEHPEWVPADLKKRLNLRAGEDKGRIYRVYPENAKLRPIPRLDALDGPGLVAAMESPNGWQRDTAQRLLVQARDLSARAGLENLVRASRFAKTRLQALSTLEGLGALSTELLAAALGDSHPAVVRWATRFCEPYLQSVQTPPGALSAALLQLAESPEPSVAHQLAFSLGEWNDPKAGRALARIALRHGADNNIQTAILSSSTRHFPEVLRALHEDTSDISVAPRLLEQLLGLAASGNDSAALTHGLGAALKASSSLPLRLGALAGFLDSLARRNMTWDKFEAQGSPEMKETLRPYGALFAEAAQIAAQADADQGLRLAAIRLLGRVEARRNADMETLADLLRPQNSGETQRAALAALRGIAAPEVGTLLLKGWNGLSPDLRGAVLDALFSRADWLRGLLAAIEDSRVSPRDLNPAYQQKLAASGDSAVRERASLLFKKADSDRQGVVDAYKPVAKLKGNAERGAELFRQNCSLCHRLQNIGNSIGADLAGLTDKSAESLLVAILDPNRTVEPKYVSYQATTKSGREIAGIITTETPNNIALRTAGGAEEVLLRSEIAELTSSRLSLMPEGFENALNQQAMADVIAFINSSSQPAKSFAGNTPARVRPDQSKALRLRASNCEIYGNTLVFENQFRNLGYWQSENDRAVWDVEIPAAGSYDVWLDAASPGEKPAHQFRLEGGGSALVGAIPATGTWENYRQTKVGTVELPGGEHRLVLRGVPPIQTAILDLREVRLVPAGSPAPADFRSK